MDDATMPPQPVGRFDPEAWARWMKDVMGSRNGAEQPAAAADSLRLAMQALETFDPGRPVHQLTKVFPRDPEVLRGFVLESAASLERRAKVLEVIILRGVHLQWSHDVMVRLLSGLMLMDQPVRRETEERLAYQRESVDLVVNSEPALFAQLSHGADPLPTDRGGRHPATEWMNTNLQEGGLLGGDVPRITVFIRWLEGLPARDRGRAISHLGDAAGAQERGRVSYLGYVESSAQAEAFGLTWAIADAHWRRLTSGVLAEVERGLGARYETGLDPALGKDRQEFYRGYLLTSRRLATAGNIER